MKNSKLNSFLQKVKKPFFISCFIDVICGLLIGAIVVGGSVAIAKSNTNIETNTQNIEVVDNKVEELSKTLRIIDGKVYTLEGKLLNQGNQIESLDELATIIDGRLYKHLMCGDIKYNIVSFEDKTLEAVRFNHSTILPSTTKDIEFIIPKELYGYKVVGISDNCDLNLPTLDTKLYLPDVENFNLGVSYGYIFLFGEVHVPKSVLENNLQLFSSVDFIEHSSHFVFTEDSKDLLYANIRSVLLSLGATAVELESLINEDNTLNRGLLCDYLIGYLELNFE